VSEVLDYLANADTNEVYIAGKQGFKLDIGRVPELFLDNTDRNRTSPFAFTGNRFEFRAVGSEANCAAGMLVLNAAVAEQLKIFKAEVDAKIASGKDKFAAIVEVLRKDIKESKAIHFDGNGYSDEWKAEAAKRGLDCETSVPLMIDAYLLPSSIKLFESTGVMKENELEARNEVKWETYTKKIQIEARVLGDLAMNHVIPIATRYQSSLIDNVYKLRDLFPADKSSKMSFHNLEIIEDISNHISVIKEKTDEMIEARKVANHIESEREKAIAYHDNVFPLFDVIRYHIDKLELLVDDEIWTLPKYRELLFIR
jgi:glutamine synthetase